MIYCANDPCEAEATHVARIKGGDVPLCATCSNAFVWGQLYPEAPVLETEPGEEGEDEDE